MESIVPNAGAALFGFLASCVLFIVFTASAIAFILTMFGLLHPDGATKTFLYGLFAASSFGVFFSISTNYLNPLHALEKLQTDSAREALAAAVQNNPDGTAADKKLAVYTQVGSDDDRGKGKALNNSLPGDKYIVDGVENVHSKISKNQIKYCNPINKSDAEGLAKFLKIKGFNEFSVTQIPIDKCDPVKNVNILEAWLQTG